MAYYSIEPWGPERNDLANAITAAMIANVNRDPRRGKPVSPIDLMAKYGQAEPEMAKPSDFKKQMLQAFGQQIKRRRKAADGR